MAQQLTGMRIAIVATDGFEQSELLVPRDALRDSGAHVEVLAPHDGRIQGMIHHEKGEMVVVDRRLDQARPEDYAALVLPGGVANPDKLRLVPEAVAFVKAFAAAGKPIAAICHGPWTLVEAGVVAGKTLTSWPSLRTDIRNAGGNWRDEQGVLSPEQGFDLVTSRKPGDLEAFDKQLVKSFAQAG